MARSVLTHPTCRGSVISDPPASRPADLSSYAAWAIGDFLETMRFRQIDILGYHTSSPTAAELVITRPKQVCGAWCSSSVPLLTEAEPESLRRAPPAVPPSLDGAHSAERVAADRGQAIGPGAPLENWSLTRALRSCAMDHTRPGLTSCHCIAYPVRERAEPDHPTGVAAAAADDDLLGRDPAGREVLPKARCIDIAEQGPAVRSCALSSWLRRSAWKGFLRG